MHIQFTEMLKLFNNIAESIWINEIDIVYIF